MQFSTITDKISFVGRKKHQRDVFWNLAQNQMRFLYNVAFRYVGNRYDAEDLVQETLYTACNKFHQLRDRRKFKSWMFIILRNHFFKWQRKKAQVQADENAFRLVKDHIQLCQTCEKLYQTDKTLDAMLKKGMQVVEPPPGLIGRVRRKIESEARPRPFRFPNVSWKTAVPALSRL